MEYDIKEIGERAYQARTRQHIKQTLVSDAIDIPQSTYSRFENGLYDLQITKILKLCDTLNVDILWLLYGDNVQDRQKSSLFCQLHSPDQE
jgi:transcriptional regulator with XRE-family HTH domain